MSETDKITKKVHDMYKKYPYPSPSTDPSQTNELLNLLKIFELESQIKLEYKVFIRLFIHIYQAF